MNDKKKLSNRYIFGNIPNYVYPNIKIIYGSICIRYDPLKYVKPYFFKRIYGLKPYSKDS